ncbi:mesoderm induction early response protein 3a [Engraulis encrasicolus]|uniref:mesoderm induction early response protein 3a n=1 Tax=Engraulis encrasicolus TaxID=184585 RepID=UPI002FCEC355
MAEASLGSESPVGSLSSEDHDFDPTAEMLVHDYDDERTLEEEEMREGAPNVSAEIADLEKESSMPLEELLAIYRYEASVSTGGGSSIDRSSVELTDELPDMTLDKEEIAKDLLSGDDEETQSSADDLTPSVTSHETTDFFPRNLRSNAIYDGDKESEGEEEGMSPEDTRKEIMIGAEYQAEIPDLCCGDEGAYEGEDQCLWRPDCLPEGKVTDFLREAALLHPHAGKMAASLDTRHVRDSEQALYELMKSNFSVHEALEHYHRNGSSSKGEMVPWSEEECRNFEHALLLYEKNFHLIQKHKVPTRTVAECVAFYYMWKKSERFDFFVQQNRFGKKKYSSYPGVTDLMDRLVDEAEGLVAEGSASVCSSSSGRMEPPTDQHINLLNSITASDLSALTSSVASVCNPVDGVGVPGAGGCLDSYGYPTALDGLHHHHRGALGHHGDDSLGGVPGVVDSSTAADCLSLLDAGFYHTELGSLAVCGVVGGEVVDDLERPPAKRMKMGLATESYLSDVGVGVGVEFEARPTHHHITSTTMAVSVTDFSEGAGGGYMGTHASHLHQHQHQHAALQSD